jgi:hypothetical protein
MCHWAMTESRGHGRGNRYQATESVELGSRSPGSRVVKLLPSSLSFPYSIQLSGLTSSSST